ENECTGAIHNGPHAEGGRKADRNARGSDRIARVDVQALLTSSMAVWWRVLDSDSARGVDRCTLHVDHNHLRPIRRGGEGNVDFPELLNGFAIAGGGIREQT